MANIRPEEDFKVKPNECIPQPLEICKTAGTEVGGRGREEKPHTRQQPAGDGEKCLQEYNYMLKAENQGLQRDPRWTTVAPPHSPLFL